MFQPKFEVSEGFRNRLAQIDEANRYLTHLSFPREKLAMLQNETLAFSTSLIVGAEYQNIGFGKVARVIETMRPDSDLSDEIDRRVREIYRILVEIHHPSGSTELIDESTLNKWFFLLEQKHEVIDKIGFDTKAYRKSPKGIQETADRVIYSAAPHDQVNSLVSDLIDWLHYESRDIHPLVQGIIAYFQMLLVRPFLRHNAKLGWFLLLAILKKHGFDFGGYVALESGLFVRKESFYNNVLRLITTTYDPKNYFSSNFQPYIMYLIPIFENTVTERVLSLERDHSRTVGEMLGKAHLNERQRRALDRVLKNKAITNREYLQINRIKSRKRAWQELTQLVAHEILVKQGQGRNVSYVLSDIMTTEAIQNHLENNLTTLWKQSGNI